MMTNMNGTGEKQEEGLGYLLTQVSFLKQRMVNAALRELEVTYMQFVILAGTYELGTDGSVVTQQTISDERRLDKAMVSNVVKTLIDKGLLLRTGHPTDGRAFTLELTPSGEEIARKGKEIAGRIDAGFFECVDRNVLYESLKKLLKNNDR